MDYTNRQELQKEALKLGMAEAFSDNRWADSSLTKLKEYLNPQYTDLDLCFLCHCAADAIGSLQFDKIEQDKRKSCQA